MSLRIDLNADVGEGMDADAELFDVITSANIACGGHVGDADSMAHACEQAVGTHTVVGAHVSYPDPENFGREVMDMSAVHLAAVITEQVLALDAQAKAQGTGVMYVKPHGALYHRIIEDVAHARAVVDAIHLLEQQLDRSLALVCMPLSVALVEAHDAGVRPVLEAFTDRAYTPDGRLVPRSDNGAVIDDPDAVEQQAVALAMGSPIATSDDTRIVLSPESLCVHGDTPGAAILAQRVRTALEARKVTIAPFVDPG